MSTPVWLQAGYSAPSMTAVKQLALCRQRQLVRHFGGYFATHGTPETTVIQRLRDLRVRRSLVQCGRPSYAARLKRSSAWSARNDGAHEKHAICGSRITSTPRFPA